jgi:hypothetical protein
MRVLPRTVLATAALISTTALGAQVAPRFEGVVYFTSTIQGVPVELTFTARGAKVRTEMKSARMNMVMLSDAEAGEAFTLNDAARTYIVFSAKGEDKDAELFTVFTRTTKTDRIAGYDCVYYHIEMSEGMKAEVCAAPGLGLFSGGKDQSFIPKSAAARVLAAKNPDFARVLRDGFLPLKWTVRTPDEDAPMTITATKVERKPIDPSLVSVPAGYKRIDYPGFSR